MLSPKQQIEAIVWKCEQVNMSYGDLVKLNNSDQIAQIYIEYEAILKQRRKEKRKAQRAKHTANQLLYNGDK